MLEALMSVNGPRPLGLAQQVPMEVSRGKTPAMH